MEKDSSYNPRAYSKEHLLSVVHALEAESYELANSVLANSEVAIGIIENHPIEKLLPKEFMQLFEKIGNPASHATAINLGLRYDKLTRIFKPTAAAILLNNQVVIDFSSSRRMSEEGQFYMQILDGEGKTLVIPPTILRMGIFTSNELETILESVGLVIPHHEQPAEWGAIGHILGSSKIWHSGAEQSILLGPDQQVLVRDTVDGGMSDVDDTPESLLDPEEVWQRTLVIGIDTAKDGQIIPSTSLQVTFKSDNPFEVPKYENITRVPIAHNIADYELFLPEFIEYPERVRSELEEKRMPVRPNAKMLDSIRNAVLEARLSGENSL